MAGVKGKSGGARANAGGARPGAGRKPNPKPEVLPKAPAQQKTLPQIAAKKKPEPILIEPGTDMLEVLQKIALGHLDATPIQLRAAIAAVQYTHTKTKDGGKKNAQAEKAKKAATGKFSTPSAPPKLVAVG